jgi:hypothetical protein
VEETKQFEQRISTERGIRIDHNGEEANADNSIQFNSIQFDSIQ